MTELDRFTRMWVGFDQLQNSFLTNKYDWMDTDYPRYNILVNKDKTEYTVEVILPGWKKDQVKIEHNKKDHVLLIQGTRDKDDREYLHRGLSGKNFKKMLKLEPHMEILNAELEQGILTITIGKVVPQELRPKLIQIK